MKMMIGCLLLLNALLMLTACNTDNNTNAPDISSVQPSIQQVEQDKLNRALQ